MIRPVLAALAFGAVSHAAIAQQAEPDMLQLEGVAALVNDTPISFFDVRQRTSMLMVTLGTQPSEEVIQQLFGTALEQLIDESLQIQMGEEFELEISDDDILSSIERLAQRSGADIQTLENQFAEAGISMATLESQIRADITYRRIMSGRFGSRIRISRSQIQDQMHRIEAQFEETSYQIGEIFLFAPDETTKAQAQTAAASIIEQLRAGTPFESAAQQFSSAPTAAAGGDMGWVTLEDLPHPSIVEAVSGRANPGILEPITTADGVYIILVRGKREPEEAIPQLDLIQIVATDNDLQTLERAQRRVDDCSDLEEVARRDDNLLMVPLGDVMLADLSEEAVARVIDLDIGEGSEPFQISRGWASLFVCNRSSASGNLPSLDQVEDELFGRELSMISERELRNARLEATILR